MALVSLRQLLDHAAENDYGVPAFNINNMEQMLAIMVAADKTDAPVILQASRGARAYANDIVLRHLIEAAVEMYPHIPVCMHQDSTGRPRCSTSGSPPPIAAKYWLWTRLRPSTPWPRCSAVMSLLPASLSGGPD